MSLRRRRALFTNIVTAVLLAVGSQALAPTPRAAAEAPPSPPGPDRVAPITVDYTAYTWWMANYDDNRVECSLTIDHEGFPTLGEIYVQCGENIYFDYKEQPPCLAGGHNSTCEGYYLYMIDKQTAQKQITVKLPPAEVWLSLEGCSSVSRQGTSICETPPVLVLEGREPLPNEHILKIEGTIDGTAFTCDPTCRIELQPTDADGVAMEFWAWSSYGDTSPVFTAQVRVAQTSDGNPDQHFWYIDVLSSQWKGVRLASCSAIWDSFPPVGGPPAWLSSPRDPADLTSDIPYNYLAANLILQGAVDASGCPDGGLTPDGGANACGQEAARPAVDEWQNQFDTLILSTSDETGVPAQLLKNLFARESQFWPGVFRASVDAGLGQLTDNGADTTLIWNPSFYAGFCPLVLPIGRCAEGYVHLEDDERTLLRNALIASVNATCEDCALGIDLSRANFSVGVFAHTLLANCEQTGQVIYNNLSQPPNTVASYEDLWKMTLVNYNAGPGCLGLAISEAWQSEHSIAWDALSNHFTEVCKPAVDYVNDISQ
ncbi:MAG TPA: hypothetical protein VIU38_08435 [Anaerolineales bacterium]